MSQGKLDTLLGDYRVLDLSDEKGVLCTKLLADFGADVIKVEPPGGDPMRFIGPFYKDIPDPEKSLYWFTFNTNKRSITLDITKRDGQEIFKRLVKTAHFLVECFEPGYMDRLGLGYEELEKINPGLVMTSISNFGATGPYAHWKATDIVATAMGGLQFLMGDRERPPVRGITQLAYAEANSQASAGTMIAHWWRLKTGEGQHVDVSMQECVANSLDTAQQTWDMMKFIYQRGGGARYVGWRLISCVHACKDGYVSTWSPEEVPTLLEWMEEKGAIDPEAKKKVRKMWDDAEAAGQTLSQFLTQEQLDEWRARRIPFLKSMTKDEIYAGAIERHFGWGPCNTPRNLLTSPQLAAREYFVNVPHPELHDTLSYAGAPFRLSETPFRIRRRPPLIGEHNQEVYEGELGLSKEELTFLKSIKVI